MFACAATLGACGTPAPVSDGGADGASPSSDASVGPEFERPFNAGITPMSNDPRTIQVIVSSEELGQQGFEYTATPQPDQIVFVDGWEVRFDAILTTFGGVRLDLPGMSPSDQSAVGASVARDGRRFAIDVHKAGPFRGAGEDSAIPLFAFQRTDAQGMLDPQVRYAFSFDVVPATGSATNVNLSPAQFPDYNEMIARGWTTLVSGTATYRGTAPAAGSPEASYPTAVRFRYGFGAPAQYINCANPDNGMEGAPGIAPRTTGAVRAQITFHMEHLFWLRLNVEDPPVHFDHFAARATMGPMGAVSTLDDLVGVAPTNLLDRMMRPIPDRGGQTMGYTPMGPRLTAQLNGASGIDDQRGFMAFSARSMAHMNADGLCFVRPTGPLRF